MKTIDFFEPHLGSAFIAQLDGGLKFPLTLFEVKVLPVTEYPGRSRVPFQLKFRGDESVLLHQQTHKLSHETLGDLDIFLVPIAQEDGYIIYQAIFN